MKKRIVYAVASVIALFGTAPHAGAAERTAKPAAGVLPVHEIITIARSAGLNPLGRPARKGTNYLLRAIDEDGQEVRVVVDGRAGEVVSITPVTYSTRDSVRGADPARASIYDSGPPVYVVRPPAHRAAPPIIVDDEPEPPVYRHVAPVPAPGYPPPPPYERDVVVIPPPAQPHTIIAPTPTPPGFIPAPPRAVYVPPAPVYVPPAPVYAPPASVYAPPEPVYAPPPAASVSPPQPLPGLFNIQPPSAMIRPAPPADGGVAPDGDEQQGLLPPPPPRFPQRVSATPPQKPATKPAKAAAKTDGTKTAKKSDAAKSNAAKSNQSSSAPQPAAPATTQSVPQAPPISD